MFSSFPFFPEQASTMAPRVDALYFFLIGVSAFFGLLVAFTVIYFAVRYRRRSDAERPAAIHGSLALEIAWSVIPFGIAMFMFFWGANVYVSLAKPPDNAMEVFVVGKQWMWKLQHMEGRREINELHVPVGKPVKLTMTSEDVIHSFFVPAFRMKQDVIPGRYTTAWFEATKPGSYHLFCAEYCGTEHAKMIGRVVVMEQAEYQAWLSGVSGSSAPGGSEGNGPNMVAAGAELFKKLGCVACHLPAGGGLGPSLVGIIGKTIPLQDGSSIVADESYLRESILNPQAKLHQGFQPIMPTFKTQLNEETLMQLIAFIKEKGGAV